MQGKSLPRRRNDYSCGSEYKYDARQSIRRKSIDHPRRFWNSGGNTVQEAAPQAPPGPELLVRTRLICNIVVIKMETYFTWTLTTRGSHIDALIIKRGRCKEGIEERKVSKRKEIDEYLSSISKVMISAIRYAL